MRDIELYIVPGAPGLTAPWTVAGVEVATWPTWRRAGCSTWPTTASRKAWTPAQRDGITAVAMDMWEPYVQSTRAHLPGAEGKIVFDKSHVVKHLHEAVDRVRRGEHPSTGPSSVPATSGSRAPRTCGSAGPRT